MKPNFKYDWGDLMSDVHFFGRPVPPRELVEYWNAKRIVAKYEA
jgi:hypothetical protein